MRRPAIVCVLTCVAFVAAGAAGAAASTLNLSVSPYTDSSGNSAAMITASGNTGADPYGEGWELDVFAAPGAATCATTAESDDANLGFPGSDTASYPGLAYVTGPFSQNFTLDPGTSTGGTYTVCAYLSYADELGQTYATAQTTAVLPAAAPPSAQPCPSGTSPELSFSAPSVVVYGRQEHVSVNSTAYGGNPTNAVLMMQAIGSAHPFYAHAFTSNELNNLEAENTLIFFIEFSRTDGPADVTLAYDENVLTTTTLSSAVCTMSKSVQVSPIVGAVPTARFTDGPSDANILFAAPGGCSKTRIVPASVTVTGHGAHMRATTADACSGHWTRRGNIPGVSIGWSANSSRGEFVFAPSGSNESYQVTVRVKGHAARGGSLNAVYFVVPSKRIWEGTDAFVNYCIDGSSTI